MPAARRLASLAAAGFALALAAGARAAAPAADQDMSLGSSKAPVTVIEYASPTCPHCAHFRAEVFPALKAKYIDTGKVRLTLRETPIHPQLDGPVFLLARCAPKGKYFDVIDAIMKGQEEYYAPAVVQGADADSAIKSAFLTVLMRTAKSVGLDEKETERCITDEGQIGKLNDRVATETKQYEVDSTPTFVVDGVKLDNGKPVDLSVLEAAIQPELAKKKPAVVHRKRKH